MTRTSYGGETVPSRRPIRDRVDARIEACADGSVRYEVLYDQHYYENGFRSRWVDALDRVGSIMLELAERERILSHPGLQ